MSLSFLRAPQHHDATLLAGTWLRLKYPNASPSQHTGMLYQSPVRLYQLVLQGRPMTGPSIRLENVSLG